VRPADAGTVCFDGTDVEEFRTVLGYVPQDDIIHQELPLERTLRYAAALRLPPSTSPAEADEAVRRALRELDLEHRAAVRVGALSGGQRKRASIAVELLTRPRVFFLDEPTSGLDPSTDAELLRVLRRLADDGATVVFTTHSVQDLAPCDRILFLAPGGVLAFEGSLPDALAFFGVDRPEQVYERLAAWERGDGRHAQSAAAATTTLPSHDGGEPPRRPERPGMVRQWWVSTRRTFETLVRNPLTVAILLGSPVLVVAMFAILFRPGAFEFADPSPNAITMILFWMTFASFFFGLTYGLLQIVTEQAIFRREHLVGLRVSAYLMSKVTVLLPFLLVVDVLMLVVLRGLDRLPPEPLETYVSFGVSLWLLATVALALGLLSSALVNNAAQATLALPMLCFPAVLFSGAILPVHIMAGIGAAISALVPVRWAFEAIGHDLGIRNLMAHGGSPLGPPLLKSYGNAGQHATGTYWAYLAIFFAVLFAGAWTALVVTTRRASR
jgi:ABC-type multidrug transport system ATPase subunit/ABC-type transport system involved in multi-copper enzyme maturation permease subunit